MVAGQSPAWRQRRLDLRRRGDCRRCRCDHAAAHGRSRHCRHARPHFCSRRADGTALHTRAAGGVAGRGQAGLPLHDRRLVPYLQGQRKGRHGRCGGGRGVQGQGHHRAGRRLDARRRGHLQMAKRARPRRGAGLCLLRAGRH